MISVQELVRRVSAAREVVEKYIREGKITADLEVPVGNKQCFRYFRPKRKNWSRNDGLQESPS